MASERTRKSRSGGKLEAGPSVERRQLTVLFCDLVSSTVLAESLAPEDLHEVLQRYQQQSAAILRRHGGYIAQYLGDGVLAYFGYPVADETAARRAVDAGLELVKAIPHLPAGRGGTTKLRARVGIHTGPVAVGLIGDAAHGERLAVGETPNLAARMQSLAEPDTVLVSETTQELVAEYFEWESLGPQSLRGSSRALTAYQPLQRSGVATALEAAKTRGLSQLCGRREELAAILAAFRDRTTRCLMISGEGGIGKSRLVHEALNALGGEQGSLVNLDCLPGESSHPFSPLKRFLERWAGIEPADEGVARAAKLAARLAAAGKAAAAADLAALMAPQASDAPVLPGLAKRVTGTFSELFRSIAGKERAVVVLEDGHWADPSTLDWARSWFLNNEADGAFLVLTSREKLAGFEGEHVTALELKPLPPEDARSLASACLGKSGVDFLEDTLRVVLERSGAVPLYVEELAAALATQRGSATGQRASDLVPASLQDALTARLDLLGPVKGLAQLIATFGKEVPFAWLKAMSPVDESDLRSELAVLVDVRILEHHATLDVYAFRHALIRDVAYHSLVRGVREEFHQRIANSLRAKFPDLASDRAELLAYHYATAGLGKEAIELYRKAGERAFSASAFAEAVEAYEQALTVLQTLEPSPERDQEEIAVRSAQGLALINSRGYSSQEVERTYARARELCEKQGEVPLKVLYGVWSVHLVRADARALSRLAPLFQRVLERKDDEATLLAGNALGVRDFFRADYRAARRRLELANALVDAGNIKQQFGRLMERYGFEGALTAPLWLAWCDAFDGHISICRQRMLRLEAIAEASNEPFLACQAAAYLATLARDLGDAGEAARLGARTMALASEHQMHFWLAFGLVVQGWVTLEHEPSAGLASIQQGLGILDAIGSLVNRGYFQSFLVDAHRKLGNMELAMQTVDDALVSCRESIGPGYEPELMRRKGELLRDTGDAAGAQDFLRAATAMARLQGVRLSEVRSAVALGTMLRDHGERDEALHVVRRAYENWPSGEVSADSAAASALVQSLSS